MDLSAVGSLLSRKQVISIAEAQARINVWDGAIRSGKTFASLLRWLIYVANAPTSGELVVVAKTSQTAARNVFGPLQDFDLFGELAQYTTYTAGAPSAVILGRRVWVIGANDARAESRLRGLTCAGAYVDEGSLVPQEFFTQLLGRMSVPGAKLFVTTNPDNPAHWLRRDFLGNNGLDLRNWHFQLGDNPSLTREYIAAISAEFTGLWYRRFILGEWVAAEGAVYDMWDEQIHVIDVVPAIQSWVCAAIDYGTTNPFHALLLGLGVDGNLYVTSEWRWDSRKEHRQLTDAQYSERLRGWLKNVRIPGTRLHGVKPTYVVIDPSAASFRVQAFQDGLNAVPADNAVLDGIRFTSTLFATERLKVARSCPALIAEIPGYSWSDEHRMKGEDVPVKVDDHGVDALRYGVMTTRGMYEPRLRRTA